MVSNEIDARHSGDSADLLRQSGYARYVRGFARLRAADSSNENCSQLRGSSRADLVSAIRIFSRAAALSDNSQLRGMAHLCEAGILELDVADGHRSASDAISAVLDRLDRIDPANPPTGYWLSSYGWWCISGCNLALRSLSGADLQRHMAVLTNKALEIAQESNNWALRERVFTMQWTGHQRLVDTTGLHIDFILDREDRGMIADTMGRFPHFREIGWRILRGSRLTTEER
jgi:hypothetical protein